MGTAKPLTLTPFPSSSSVLDSNSVKAGSAWFRRQGSSSHQTPVSAFGLPLNAHKTLGGWCCPPRDIGGQAKLRRRLWRHYYANTDALIFVLDSSDHERMEEARDEMFHVLEDLNVDDCQTVLIFLNKQVRHHTLFRHTLLSPCPAAG